MATALEDEMKKADQIAEEKAKVRNQIKELRPKIVEAALKVSSEQNEKIVMNRQLSGAQASLAEVNQLQYEEKHAIQEIKNATQTLKSETATMKGSMQSDKDKIIQIFQEIDKTRTSTFKLQASINAMKDSELVAAEENERLMKEHANLMSKSNRQTDLSEQLRDERNKIFSQIKRYIIYHACLHTIYIVNLKFSVYIGTKIKFFGLFRYQNMLLKSLFLEDNDNFVTLIVHLPLSHMLSYTQYIFNLKVKNITLILCYI